MCRSSLAHERQSILQAARIAELERELARLRASPTLGATPDSTGSAERGPVASEPAANSDGRPPATQKGRWWGLR